MSCGAMNMDEFLHSNPMDIEGNQYLPLINQNEPRVEPFPRPAQLGKKTIDEVWFDISKGQSAGQPNHNGVINVREPSQHQQTLGEMTLEDFLIKAGVVPGSSTQNSHRDFSSHSAGLEMNFGMGTMMGSGMPNQQIDVMSNLTSGSLTAYHMLAQSCSLVGESSENGENGSSQSTLALGGAKGRKKMVDGSAETAVGRRQQRMIKNRESAARSRARKQAYTVELELELNQLKEENGRLKLDLAAAEQKRKQRLLKGRPSTKAQKTAAKLRMIRRTNSLSW